MTSIYDDAEAVARSGVVGKILESACRLTGMRFAAVARVTANRWLACAVRDEIAFGLPVGGELDVLSTLCHEVGACGHTIAIDHVASDPVYRDHPTPRQYGFQSYISTPVVRHGAFFGTLCALDPEPRNPSDPALVATFELYAELIGRYLESDMFLARSAALITLGDRLRDLEDPAELSFAAAEILGETLAVSRTGYATVDASGETASIERDWTAPGIASITGDHSFRHYGSFIEDLRRGEAVVITNAQDDARTITRDHALDRISARALVNIPVVEQGKLVALLYLHNAEPRIWTPDELAFVRDVADRTRSAIERRRAERDLKHLNDTLERQVAERTAERDQVWRLSHDLFVVVGTDGILRAVNPAWEDVLGQRPSDVVGRSFLDFVWSEDAAITQRALGRAAGYTKLTDFENRYRHADGTPRWISWHTSTEGELVYAYGRDITVEKEQAAALRLFAHIVQSDRSPVCAFDTEYRLIAFNKAHNDEFYRVNGFYTKIGDVFPDLFSAKQQPLMRGLMQRALSGEQFTVVEAFGRPDLAMPNWEISYSPLRDEAGNIIGAFHHARDISDRLTAEAELTAAQDVLRQSQKMEAMGNLTGGVAHDFNNLLTPIIGSLDMLVRKGVGTEREQRLIAGALQSADRAKMLVQRLLAFARRQPLQPDPVDVHALVHGMADLIHTTLGPKIVVKLDIEPDLPPAQADFNQLEMALLNLAVNARDAMPDGGSLVISAVHKTVSDDDAVPVPAGHYVCLSVKDTGAGMDEATQARAIEPFFSTKGVGKGTGLGLSMVHGLAAQLGGNMTISSAPGEGTTVALCLPVSVLASDGALARAALVPGPTLRGTVLLVDDEDLVRMTTADMLVDLGYRVVEAVSGEDALTRLELEPLPDLVVSDHLMPGISGAELARLVRAIDPNLPVLIVSGYAEAEGLARDLPMLSKPFRRDDLAAKLAEIAR